MKFIIFITIVAASSAAQLPSRNYLPQSSSSSSQGFQQSSQQSQSFQSSQIPAFVPLGGSSDNGNRRPQQEQEKIAQVVKLDQEVNAESGDFHYSYETSNGIRAEEAGNTVQSSGGFSYKGDDGNTYTVTFTAGEGGFRPEGAHLPVPPPTPQEILLALEQNAKDEAAGIFDDGKYHPDSNGGASGHKSSGSFSSSSSSSSLSSSQFGSSNRQGNFNANSGYSY